MHKNLSTYNSRQQVKPPPPNYQTQHSLLWNIWQNDRNEHNNNNNKYGNNNNNNNNNKYGNNKYGNNNNNNNNKYGNG